jgi:hypothetical protein
VQLGARSSVDESLLPDVEATVRLTDRASGQVAHESHLRVPRVPRDVELGAIAPGTYTVTVQGRRGTAPLSDVLVVAAPEEVE